MVAIALREDRGTAPETDDGVTPYSQGVKSKLDLSRFKTVGGGTEQVAPAEDPTRLFEGEIEALHGQLQPVWIPESRTASFSLEPLQEWEGYVIDIRAEKFSARLVDVTKGKKVEEEVADFPLSDLSEDNLALLKEGAVFRWVIGYQRSSSGNKRRVSEVTFRRLPAWTKRDLEAARAKAATLAEEISWE